jgi:hypothetical protein
MITLTREEAQHVLDAMENAIQLGQQGIALSSSGVLFDAIETLRKKLNEPDPYAHYSGGGGTKDYEPGEQEKLRIRST